MQFSKEYTYVSHSIELNQVKAGSWVLCTEHFLYTLTKLVLHSTHIQLTESHDATKYKTICM